MHLSENAGENYGLPDLLGLQGLCLVGPFKFWVIILILATSEYYISTIWGDCIDWTWRAWQVPFNLACAILHICSLAVFIIINIILLAPFPALTSQNICYEKDLVTTECWVNDGVISHRTTPVLHSPVLSPVTGEYSLLRSLFKPVFHPFS